MIDDIGASTGGSTGEIKIELAKYASTITQYRTDRRSSQRWARDLRFLTFDGNQANDKEVVVEGSVNAKKQCQQCEQNLEPIPGHICAAHRLPANTKYLKTRETGIARDPDTCIHVFEATCQDCQHLPLFPNTGRPTKFRIKRLRLKNAKLSGLSGCNHFAAVSYCWSDSEQSNSDTSSGKDDAYTVMEEDGVTVRKTRAPKMVIDRAVDFCRQNGVRMIWIDQECIQQDDEVEKNIGVQAMDIVYSRALFSIGLFQSGFKDQRDLDAFCTLGQGQTYGAGFSLRPGRCKPPLPAFVDEQAFVDMLYRLSEDRWLIRAWIFQEAFASGGEMILLMPKPQSTSISGFGRNILCNDLSTTEVAIKFYILDQVLKNAVTYYDKDLDKDADHIQHLNHSKRDYDHLRDRKLLRRLAVRSLVEKGKNVKLPKDWSARLDLLKRLYPEVLSSVEIPRISYGIPVHFRPSNAAVALTFLANRCNSVPADRLAIIANLCDYHVRLDVGKVENSELPLSACIFMLALMNGDLSLLCPESYRQEARAKLMGTNPDSKRAFSWLHIDAADLTSLKMDIFSPDSHSRGRDDPSIYSLTEAGFSIPGSLWKVDRLVDLSTLKRRYSAGWNNLQARRKRKAAHRSDELEEEYHLAVTHILFDILSLLRTSGELEAANAIWQSTFDSRWGGKPGLDAIETVDKWPEGLEISHRAGMFRIDVDTTEDYYCAWLIERVMSNGGLWVGSLVNGSFGTALDGFEQDASSAFKKSQFAGVVQTLMGFVQNQKSLGHSSKAVYGNIHKFTGPSGISTPLEQKVDWGSQEKISHGTWQYFEANMRTALDDIVVYIDGIGFGVDSSLTHEGLLSFAWAKFLSSTTDSSNYFTSQRAVFDVDGDSAGGVHVLTPYRRTLEMIPTPAARAMTNSWVVEAVDPQMKLKDGVGVAQGGNNLRTLRTGKMVRGMWPLQDIPGTQYLLV